MSTRLARLIRLEQEIRKGNYPSVSMLCEKLEIQPRTLFADIKELRKRLGLSIKYDRYKNGYYNSDPTKQLPTFELSPEELNILNLAKIMLMQYTGPSFEPIIRSAINKISLRLSSTVHNTNPNPNAPSNNNGHQDFFKAIYFAPFASVNLSYKLFSQAVKACNEHRAMIITYQSARTGDVKERLVYPYKIVQHDSTWYLCGFCFYRQAFRAFALHRIKALKIVNETFKSPTEVQIDEWLDSAFKLDLSDKKYLIQIHFQPQAARYIRDRQWHISQKILEKEDGSCTLQLFTSALQHLKSWLLAWGSQAEVIKPQWLRLSIARELHDAAAKYE
jgi:predicted DNA-binding transcriptional regulator YafY